jgi:hypothetical protein
VKVTITDLTGSYSNTQGSTTRVSFGLAIQIKKRASGLSFVGTVPAARNGPSTPLRVLYIMGHSRSGSTILNNLLGFHQQVVAVGELANLVERGWNKHLPCSCGEPGDLCPFWREVRQHWNELAGGEDLPRYARLQRRFERTRSIPLILYSLYRGDPLFNEYVRSTILLFTAVARVAGRDVIVDASKNPVRALALSRAPEIDLTIVHLIRDARGVAWSFNRSSQPVAKTAFFWMAITLISSLVSKFSRKSLLLRYEDLARFPRTALGRIQPLVGLSYDHVSAFVEAGGKIPSVHCIAGNRLRMKGPVQLRLDEQWRSALPLRGKILVWLLAGWLLRCFGYRRARPSVR